ncbi:FMN-binding negative transcriptional regulator [Histidinibacterium lentulum]|uniref:FMN-binding negative transcriptional regulator n=1 Tax=Histidinibacterium lentulum TaxID=2480588 RepID=A0A3N2R1P9_9RHOB|nr:FMN-binding negative transcriptional regulator [Histidinibacterium lentulum]ROU01268.1 FMN-binding negative transcriptional regulator [Histidinibacterium lentulum]
MHPNPAFRGETEERSAAFAAERGFGVLAVNGAEGPVLAHVPFLLSADRRSAELHLVRSGPIARMAPVEAVIAVTGPDAYVSPDWYGVADQVPTWNYVAVHLRGRLLPLDAAEMRPMLERQSAGFESGLGKAPWTMAKMSEEAIARMLRQILPFRLEIARIDGTWKLGQNKPAEVRRAAAARMAGTHGSEPAEVARLMDEA